MISDSLAFQRLVEGYLLRAAQRSDIFAHILIWHLQVCEISRGFVYSWNSLYIFYGFMGHKVIFYFFYFLFS